MIPASSTHQIPCPFGSDIRCLLTLPITGSEKHSDEGAALFAVRVHGFVRLPGPLFHIAKNQKAMPVTIPPITPTVVKTCKSGELMLLDGEKIINNAIAIGHISAPAMTRCHHRSQCLNTRATYIGPPTNTVTPYANGIPYCNVVDIGHQTLWLLSQKTVMKHPCAAIVPNGGASTMPIIGRMSLMAI